MQHLASQHPTALLSVTKFVNLDDALRERLTLGV